MLPVKSSNSNGDKGPLEVAKQGSITVPIYATTNRIYRVNPATGQRELKSEHPQFTVIYYEGSRRIKRKFSDLAKARREADLAAIKLSNGEADILKLTGTDRADYVHAMRQLQTWNACANLNLAVTDYVAAVKRLPENTSLKEVVDFYLKRHPAGLPSRTVQQVVDELVESKEKSGKSGIYIRKMRQLLGHFGTAFKIQIALVTGKQIEDYIRGLGVGGRTQNNNRQLINTLFKFAIKRGYLPKDHDEMNAVELAENNSGEIEVFTPAELRSLLNTCIAPVQERGKWRDREKMIPYLAVAAFCGLRSAEIARLDWSEVHLTGAEHFIEVKAAKAKTASRRIVPISENCARWLAPFISEGGPVCEYLRPDKQCCDYLAPLAKLQWKHNGLRHAFISYRVELTKNVHQVSLEAGNSPSMVFKHYLKRATEAQATEWFGIVPPKGWKNIAPMPAEVSKNMMPLAASM